MKTKLFIYIFATIAVSSMLAVGFMIGVAVTEFEISMDDNTLEIVKTLENITNIQYSNSLALEYELCKQELSFYKKEPPFEKFSEVGNPQMVMIK